MGTKWVPNNKSTYDIQCVAMFDETPLRDATPVLANAFVVEDVAYQWKRGRVVHVPTVPV